MKNLVVTSSLLLLFGGCNYLGFSAGPGGEFDASSNFTFEYGFADPTFGRTDNDSQDSAGDPEPGSDEREFMLTSGFTVIDNGIDLYWFESNPEMGGFMKLGIEVAPETGFFVNVLGGITFIHWASYWDEGTDWHGLLGGGVTYFINDENFCLVAAYDNRRFFTGGVGWRF